MNNTDLVHKYRFQKYIEDENFFHSHSLITGRYWVIYYWILAAVLVNISEMCYYFYIFIQGCIS